MRVIHLLVLIPLLLASCAPPIEAPPPENGRWRVSARSVDPSDYPRVRLLLAIESADGKRAPQSDVFLSGHDLFIHNGYFREPWQVAPVVEPEKDHGGFFRWRGGRMDGHRCGGFHEVVRGESVVTWTNVRPAEGE